MSKAQREKGKRFERWVRNALAPIFPDALRLGWMQTDFNVPDVQAGPFRVECKHRARVNIIEALEQAEKGCPKGMIPIAICKTNNQEATITLRLEDGLDLIKEWWELKNR